MVRRKQGRGVSLGPLSLHARYAGSMSAAFPRTLLIDTCGEGAAVALAEGAGMVRIVALEARAASKEIFGAVRALLGIAGVSGLSAVAVVNGPGSFTGVRTGIAAAKGFCEAAGLPLVAVSRLAVLAQRAVDTQGAAEFAALFAGRGEWYVREVASGREWLAAAAELDGKRVIVCEQRAAELLPDATIVAVSLAHALPLVLKTQAVDAALVDANYVRREEQIYAKRA
jgi:tRNA threonylcarbamoyladenosine biosynthesis protein TsaB